MTPAWAEHCRSFLPCAEGGYWQDFGWEPGSTLRAPGTGLRFAPLWFCFPPQCSSGSSPWWRSVEQGARQGYQPSPVAAATTLCPWALKAWPRTQTWDWSFTMAASISELDSFSSLISLFSCLISSSFSRTAGGKVTGSQQMLLGEAKVLGFLLSPSCCTVLTLAFTASKQDVPLTCLFLSILFMINIFIITVQWCLNRSICRCKSKGQQSSWSPTHPHTWQGWLSWTIRSHSPILSLERCYLKKLMHVLMRNYEVYKIRQYFWRSAGIYRLQTIEFNAWTLTNTTESTGNAKCHH